MSKVVRAVNAMITKPDKISDVRASDKELFFVFDSQYAWSISKEKDGHYKLYFYPNYTSTEELSEIAGPDWNDVAMVTYSTKDLNTVEASESFIELYTLVNEKVLGVDKVFDDIINKYEPF